MAVNRREVLVWGGALGLFAMPIPVAVAAWADDDWGGGGGGGDDDWGDDDWGDDDWGNDDWYHDSDPIDTVGIYGTGDDPLGIECRAPTLSGSEMNALQSLGTESRIPSGYLGVPAECYSADQYDRMFQTEGQTFLDQLIEAIKEASAFLGEGIREGANYLINGTYACVGISGGQFTEGVCVVVNGNIYAYTGVTSSQGPELQVGLTTNDVAFLSGPSVTGTFPAVLGGVGGGVTPDLSAGAVFYSFSFSDAVVPGVSGTYGEARGNLYDSVRSGIEAFERGAMEWFQNAERQLYEMSQDPFDRMR
jgi:hypothetical protein